MTASVCSPPLHTVLVVDDEPGVVGLVRSILQADGLRVLSAADGLEAWELLATEAPCLAILDVVMPGLGGYELCRRMRHDPRLSAVPVVFLSAMTRAMDIAEGIAAGGNDYISKPFDKQSLRFRVQAQLRLHEARTELDHLRDRIAIISRAARDAIILMDDRGRVVHWNEAAEAMFGYTEAEARDRNLHQLIAPARYVPQHQACLASFGATGDGDAVGQTIEFLARRRSGQKFPIELSVSATQVQGAWWAVGIIRDVTARKQAEERYRLLFENSHDALVIASPPDWQFTSANPAALTLFGAATAEEFLSKAPWELSPPTQADGQPSAPAGQARIAEALAHGRTSFRWTHQNLRGEEFAAHVQLTRIRLDDVVSVLATVRDTTEQQRHELALQQTRKLEAVGQLASGIAHEINTPTQYVSDSVHFLKEAYDALATYLDRCRQATAAEAPGDAAAALAELRELEDALDLPFLMDNVGPSLERCFDGLGRVANIVRAMKEFAHPDQREKAPLDLNHALDNTLVIARNEYKYVADVETSYDDLPLVECHAGDLNQVFLNLIVNSAHAIAEVVGDQGGRGAIRISTRRDGEVVQIDIADTGCGIPEAVGDRIYDPFFTTKPVGKGSGQGLAIARSIVVDKHGGSLTMASEVGRGTTFSVRLPISASPTAVTVEQGTPS